MRSDYIATIGFRCIILLYVRYADSYRDYEHLYVVMCFDGENYPYL